MNPLQRLIVTVAALLLAGAFAACGGGQEPSATSQPVATATAARPVPSPTPSQPTASQVPAPTPRPTLTPEQFSARAKEAMKNGLQLADVASSLAVSFQTFDKLDPGTASDGDKLVRVLQDLQQGLSAYVVSINSVTPAIAELKATLGSAAPRSALHPREDNGMLSRLRETLSNPFLGRKAYASEAIVAEPVSLAQQVGVDDAADLNKMASAGIDEAKKIQECYKKLTIDELTKPGSKKKEECDAAYRALHTEMLRQGFGSVAGTSFGAFAGGATAVYLGAGALTGGGALLVIGVGVAASKTFGFVWDYCTAPESGGGLQKQVLRPSCGYVSGKGKDGESFTLPASGKGNLTLFVEGRAPVILSGVAIKSGQVTSVRVSPPPLEGVKPADVVAAVTASTLNVSPPTPTATRPPAVPTPTPTFAAGNFRYILKKTEVSCGEFHPVAGPSCVDGGSDYYRSGTPKPSLEIADGKVTYLRVGKAKPDSREPDTSRTITWTSLPSKIRVGETHHVAVKGSFVHPAGSVPYGALNVWLTFGSSTTASAPPLDLAPKSYARIGNDADKQLVEDADYAFRFDPGRFLEWVQKNGLPYALRQTITLYVSAAGYTGDSGAGARTGYGAPFSVAAIYTYELVLQGGAP